MYGDPNDNKGWGVSQGGWMQGPGIVAPFIGAGQGQRVLLCSNPDIERLSDRIIPNPVISTPHAPGPKILSTPIQMQESPIINVPNAGIWRKIKRYI